MSNESSTEEGVVSLCARRRDRDMEKAWEELALAVGALKDSEFHLLRAWASMQSLQVDPVVPEAIEAWAKTIQEATTISQGFLEVLGDELGYDDPFSSSSSEE